MSECPLAFLGLAGGVERAAVGVWPPELDDARHAGLARPAAWIAGEGDGPVGATVVAAVVSEHLGAVGVQPGHAHGVLGRLCTAVGEEHHVQVAVDDLLGGHFADQASGLAAGVVGVERGHGAQSIGLLFDRSHQLGVLVADVDVDELAGEIEVASAVLRPEVAPLGARHHRRVQRALGAPGMEDVSAIVGERILGMGVEHGHGHCHGQQGIRYIRWRTDGTLYPYNVVTSRQSSCGDRLRRWPVCAGRWRRGGSRSSARRR